MPEIERLTIAVDADDKGVMRTLGKIDAEISKVAENRTAKINVKVDDKDIVKAKASLANLDTGVLNFNQRMLTLSKVIGAVKFPAMIEGISLAAQAITSLGGGAIALTSALTPLAGLLATIPQQLLGIGAAAIVGAAGIKSVTAAITAQQALAKEATKANRDAYEASLVGLSEGAKQFVGTLGTLLPQIKEFANGIGSGIFDGLNEFMANGPKKIMDSLRPELYQMGQTLGQALNQIGQAITTPEFLKQFNDLLAANRPLLMQFAEGVSNVIQGLMNLMTTAKPLTDFWGDLATGATKAFAEWSKSDGLSDFLQRSIPVTKQFVDILGNLWGILRDVGKAAQPLGQWILDSFQTGAQSLKDFTGSAQGLAKMTAYFDSMKAPLREIGGLIGDLLKVFVSIGQQSSLAQFVALIRSELIPVLADFQETTFKAFGTALVSAVAAVGRVFVSLSGTTGGLTGVVNMVALLANTFAKLLEWIPPLKTFIVLLGTLKAAMLGLKAVGLGSIFNGFNIMGSAKDLTGLAGAFQLVTAHSIKGVGSLTQWRQALSMTVTGGQAATAAIMSVAAAMLVYKQAVDQAWASHKTFVEGMQANNEQMSRQGIAGLEEMNRGIQANIDAINKSWDNADIVNKTMGILKRDRAADDASISAMDKQIERNNQAIDLAKRLAAETGESTDLTMRYAASLLNSGQNLDYNSGRVKELYNWMVKVNAQTAQGASIEKWLGKLNLGDQLNTPDLQKQFFTPELLSTLDAVEVATNNYNTALASVKSLEGELASAQSARMSALKSYESALKSVTQAQKALAQAEKQLAEARKGATQLQLDRGNLSYKQALLEQKRAVEDLNLLYKELAKTAGGAQKTISMVNDEFTGKTYEVVRIQGGQTTEKDMIDRQRQIEDAKLRIEQANLSVRESEEALQDLYKKGTDQDEAVIAAKEAVLSAMENVNEAQANLRESAINLNKANADVARVSGELQRAQSELARATEVAKAAQEAAYEAIAKAGKRMGIEVGGAILGIAGMLGAGGPLQAALYQSMGYWMDYASVVGNAADAMSDAAIRSRGGIDANTAKTTFDVGSKFRMENNLFIPDGGGTWVLTRSYTGARFLLNTQTGERREHGGSASKGQPLLIGEKRPEMFVPNTDGYIMPRVTNPMPSSTEGNGSGPQFNMVFNEKVDPMLVGHEIAWSLT